MYNEENFSKLMWHSMNFELASHERSLRWGDRKWHGGEHSRGTAELSQLSSDGVSLECQGEKRSMRYQGLKRLDTQRFVKKKWEVWGLNVLASHEMILSRGIVWRDYSWFRLLSSVENESREIKIGKGMGYESIVVNLSKITVTEFGYPEQGPVILQSQNEGQA